MLVRLTFVKRFTRAGVTYMTHRVYKVDDTEAANLCNITVNDMPVFKVVLPGQVKEKETVIDLSSETVAARAVESAGDIPDDESVEDAEARFKAEAAANRKALADRKKTVKAPPVKKAAKLATSKPQDDSNVDMVE